MAAFSEETITLASGRPQVVHRGGDGPSLLWLHSLFGFDPTDPLLEELAKHYSIVAPVSPGFADTGELKELMDVHDLAQLYDDILVALDLSEVTVVGHSFGAMIGAELAARHPDAVAKLALLSPLGLWSDDRPVEDLFAVPYPQMPALLYVDPSHASGDADTSTLDGDVERLVTLAQAMTSVAKFLWPIPDRRLRTRLYRVSMATLVVWGADDAVVPSSYADDFVAALPDARSEIVSQAGHMVHIEQPEGAVASVMSFLGDGASS
jgi:pimeloyl-ACP methyl ester carboxylesterase